MKRVIASVLALAMVFTLAACGAVASASPAPAPAETAAAPAETLSSDAEAIAAKAAASFTYDKPGKNVYFASPMFAQGEKDYNAKVVEVLEKHGYCVFLPQRDGIEAALLEGLSDEEMTKIIFDLDYKRVSDADIVFMNIDGRVPDEGGCVELGMAYALGKRCYGLKSDTRSLELGMDLNPLIGGAMIKIFKNFDGHALIEEIDQYLNENEL